MITKEIFLADIAMNSYQRHTACSSTYNASVFLFADCTEKNSQGLHCVQC